MASISFGSGELPGAPISSSNGHLLVIVGFTSSGDVVVNDPAATTSAGVRRTYDRGQFENAWLPTSGGTVYVIHDAAHPLPGALTPTGRSGGGEVERVQAGRAVGQHVRLHAGLHEAVAVGGPHLHQVIAGLDVDLGAPLHPAVLVGHLGEDGLLPGTTVDGDLHPVDPGVLRPGHPGEGDRADSGTSSPDLGTSIREDIFTGPNSPQPRSVQYAVISENFVTSQSTTHLQAET